MLPPTIVDLVGIVRSLEKKLGSDWWDMDGPYLEEAIVNELSKRKMPKSEMTRVMAAALAYYSPRPTKDPVSFIHFMHGINGIEGHAALFESLSRANVIYGLVALAELTRIAGRKFSLSGKVLEYVIQFVLGAGLPIMILNAIPPYRHEYKNARKIIETRYPDSHANSILLHVDDDLLGSVLKAYESIRGDISKLKRGG